MPTTKDAQTIARELRDEETRLESRLEAVRATLVALSPYPSPNGTTAQPRRRGRPPGARASDAS